MRLSRLALSLALGHSLLLAGTASAATFSGTISTASGLHVSGALVTLLSQDATRKQTVYSDAAGRFAIEAPFTGKLKLRVRTPFYDDVLYELAVSGDEHIAQDVVLSKKQDRQAQSDSLSSSAHAATLKFEDPKVRDSFVSQCNYCHQVGNSLTRRPRDKAAWEQTVGRMQGYMAMLNRREEQSIANTLHEGFQGQPVANVQTYEYSPDLASAKVEEWLVGDGLSFIHDAEIGHLDGKFYGADEGHDVIWELDPETHQIVQHKLPEPPGLPVGGKFAGFQLPIGVFNGKHGPHSMAEDKDGKFWITNALSSYLISFDTKSKEFEQFPIGGDTLYPHTIRIDKAGMVWFTIAVSNQVGRFDPQTKQFTLIDLPSNGWKRWLTDALFPSILKVSSWFPQKNLPLVLSHHRWSEQGKDVLNLPYGIDVNPKDGSIWYAKLLSSKLGRIDPQTLEVTEIDTPLSGPRRPRFDRDGILWIPAFDHGAIMRFDPQSKDFKSYKMPTLAPNEYEAPYALNVHPQTGDVWITSNTSDRLFRFDPQSEQFTAYPLPTRVTWMRDLVFTRDGKVCNSSSNLPAYAIEDGRPSMLCLDPSGGEKDREKLGAE